MGEPGEVSNPAVRGDVVESHHVRQARDLAEPGGGVWGGRVEHAGPEGEDGGAGGIRTVRAALPDVGDRAARVLLP